MVEALSKQLSKLNKNEKLLLVEALWDSIASDPEDVELPANHKAIIEERLKTFEEDKAKGADWDDFIKKYI
ncbi:MAG: addiction module protein [Balneolales bacterium]